MSRGVRNTIDALRFSQGEVDRFADWVTELLSAGASLPPLVLPENDANIMGGGGVGNP